LRADLVRVSETQRELYLIKQNNLSVIDFLNELKAFWEELNHCKPLTVKL